MKSFQFLTLPVCLFLGFHSNAQIHLPGIISDGMVLQREKPVKIWGSGNPNRAITVGFDYQTYHTQVGRDSLWQIVLPAHAAGGPFDMTIQDADTTIVLHDMLVGEVWLASGQSNMELTMARLADQYPREFTGTGYPMIRQFYVPRAYDFNRERTDVDNRNWIKAVPAQLNDFSGVAYFFAQSLYDSLHVPIGIINSALGGSPAQAWIDEAGLAGFPEYLAEKQIFAGKAYRDSIDMVNNRNSRDWLANVNANDRGLHENWQHNTVTGELGWKTVLMPAPFKAADPGYASGAYWLKKEIDIPAALAGKPCRLWLGRIVDADTTYINGKYAGNVTYQYPPRKYTLPAGMLRAGSNQITVRVLVQGDQGEFVRDKFYGLIFENGDTISLSGKWQIQQGCSTAPAPPYIFTRWKAEGLFNGMIAPLLPYCIRGVIWYQGESNTKYPDDYDLLMRTLIQRWRSRWQDEAMPFYYVQLANFMTEVDKPTESTWAALRQQQLNTLQVPNTAMAVAIDLGEWNDIHPLNKKEVGRRLALPALKNLYGRAALIAAGPQLTGHKVKKDEVTLSFDDVSVGSRDIRCFELAGANKQFFQAAATVVGNKIVLRAPEVSKPRYVRYAWKDNPGKVNLYNAAGLPASPFELKL